MLCSREALIDSTSTQLDTQWLSIVRRDSPAMLCSREALIDSTSTQLDTQWLSIVRKHSPAMLFYREALIDSTSTQLDTQWLSIVTGATFVRSSSSINFCSTHCIQYPDTTNAQGSNACFLLGHTLHHQERDKLGTESDIGIISSCCSSIERSNAGEGARAVRSAPAAVEAPATSSTGNGNHRVLP